MPACNPQCFPAGRQGRFLRCRLYRRNLKNQCQLRHRLCPILPRKNYLQEGRCCRPRDLCLPGAWGLREPSVVVVVVFVVVVVVPPSGTVSPTFTVVPRAQHAPVKRARQIINASFIRIARIISRMPILRLALKRFANPERI